MTDFWDSIFNFAEAITAQVGAQLLADFGRVVAEEKADGSLVTQADLKSDRMIREAIAATFPDHGILAEESSQIFPDNEWCWIVDPLDGTTNFSRGIPLWGISLALLYQGVPVFGFVRFPPIGQTFHGVWLGESGLGGLTGAFLNGQPIRPSLDAPSGNHFFSFCSRSLPAIEHPFPCKIRMMGVATYNLLTVAAGIALGAVEATPKVWDTAAVWAIIKASGGVWIDLGQTSPFPLQIGRDYSRESFPCLVVSRSDLESVFLPIVRSVSSSQS
jgi:myo-inositol-1(or 4)-monophosphatase